MSLVRDAGSGSGPPAAAPRVRGFGAVNRRGLWTLYLRGVKRHLGDAWETLGGPCVSAALFLAVFTLAAQDRFTVASELSIGAFIAPGIVVFAISHAAYESAAAAILTDKHGGMIGDLLGAPLTALELTLGHLLSAATNGLATGAAVLLMATPFVELAWPGPLTCLAFAGLAALLFGSIGILTGLWAERWEQYSAVESFLVLPLMFLSGAFFTRADLPEAGQLAVAVNPLFYAVDGMRQGLAGHGEVAAGIGAAVLAALTVGLFLLAWRLFFTGWKIKP